MREEVIIFILALAVATVTSMPHIEFDDIPKTHEDTRIENRSCDCGANAKCVDGKCFCLPNYFGDPYHGCRPECIVNSDCPSHKACVNQNCKDPCVGTCGKGADCAVISHIPICSCPTGRTGNPFVKCDPISDTDRIQCQIDSDCSDTEICELNRCIDPCVGMCGKNAVCSVINRMVKCECPVGTFGDPFMKCSLNNEEGAFVVEPSDACSTSPCGENAECQVHGNNDVSCSCPIGMFGNPYESCKPLVERPASEVLPPIPCTPSPCGPNSFCREENDHAVCSCLPGYVGSPPACKPKCIANSDCNNMSACINQKCQDPCVGSCGQDAECTVINHTPLCTCLPGMTGDPFVICNPIPTCVVSSDCSANQACINQRCIDPCLGTCGKNAQCEVKNHNPICSCQNGMMGNPFEKCYGMETMDLVPYVCTPNPCGPNSSCREHNGYPLCTCQPGFIGNPPNCKPKCTINSDCSMHQACIQNSCKNPCIDTCGQNARCDVVHHTAQCSCIPGMSGDPYVHCKRISERSIRHPKYVKLMSQTISQVWYKLATDVDSDQENNIENLY